MFADVDLKKIAEMTAPERTYLSVYIAGGHSLGDLEKKFHKVRSMLKGGGIEKDEREYLSPYPFSCTCFSNVALYHCFSYDSF
jgi:hypothetical protein